MRAFDKEYYTDILYLQGKNTLVCAMIKSKFSLLIFFFSYLFNRIFCKAKITQKSVKRLRKKAM